MRNIFKSGFMIKTTTRQQIILYQAVIVIKPLFMSLPKANGVDRK